MAHHLDAFAQERGAYAPRLNNARLAFLCESFDYLFCESFGLCCANFLVQGNIFGKATGGVCPPLFIS